MVRFHPSELATEHATRACRERRAVALRQTEVIRLDEEPVSKTGVPIHRDCEFESHDFRLRAHGPTGRHRLRKPRIRVRFPVSPLGRTVPWSSGDDS